MREAAEEVGVDPRGVDVVAALPELFIPPNRFRVVPVLAWWRRPCAVAPVDPGEVAAVTRVSVGELADPAAHLSTCGSFVSPTRFEDLRRAASDGPVVIVSISRYRCDALAVTSSGVRQTRLDTTAGEVQRQVVAFVSALDDPVGLAGSGSDGDPADEVLDWLFTKIAEPVLRDLGFTSAQRPQAAPRLWWCPTGLLSFLPLHAARARRPDVPAVLDCVASSYTPTLRALSHARTRPAVPPAPPRTLVVSVPEPRGYAPRPARPGK